VAKIIPGIQGEAPKIQPWWFPEKEKQPKRDPDMPDKCG
jgi:hypothetical protein